MLTTATATNPLPGPLEFDVDTHTYRVGGAVWPSVTQILQATGVSTRWSDLPPSARAAVELKRDIGAKVHEACRLLDLGKLSWGSLDDALFGYVEAWERYVKESGITGWALIEQPMAHATWGYAGTPDRLTDEGLLTDIKCGDPDDAAGQYQTAAYAELIKVNLGRTVSGRECVRLYADGRYTLDPYPRSAEDQRRWFSILTTFNCQPERNRR